MLTLHTSLAIQLATQAGSSASLRARAQHRTRYAGDAIAAAHTAQWRADITPTAQHRAPWRTLLAAAHTAPYTNRDQAQARHTAAYTNWPQAGTAHRAKWGLTLAARHRAPSQDPAIAAAAHSSAYTDKATRATLHRTAYTDKATRATLHRTAYRLQAAAQASHAAAYQIQAAAQALAAHRAPYHLLNAAIYSISNTPAITHAGATLPIFAASLSADEDSPHWLASITLTSAADYARIQIGDTITLHLGPTDYTLRIDAKASQRQSAADTTYTASAISPLAWLDAPWAGQADHIQTTAVLASAAVQAIIGPVQWTAPDWTLPAGALQITSATPLAAARTIAAAIGAVIESQPDGTPLVRPRHPISPPAYTLAACTHHLTDATTFASAASAAPLRGFNRLEVTNNTSVDASASADSLEYVPDDTSADATSGTVRAILASARSVLLAHSGHPSTAITAQGNVTRTETELAEFVAGQANLQYPADNITTCTWQHTDLGAPAITAGDATAITTATPGYSLARISYQTTALQWRVQLASPAETVQFILLDA